MNELTLDFESYYSTQDKYDLKSISMTEYVRSPKFQAFGAGVAYEDTAPVWIKAGQLRSFFDHIDWKNITLVGQNIKFDAAILAWKYGHTPAFYVDTKGMSRAVLGKSIKNHSLATLAEHFGLQSKGQLMTNGKIVLTEDEERQLAEYCLHDVWLTREIRRRLAHDFPQSQYEVLHHTVRMFVEPKLRLNVPLLEKAAVDEANRRANIFREIGIEKGEFSSNVKFPALLKKEGYEVPMKESPRKKDEAGNPVKIPALALGDTDFLEMLEGEDERLRTLCEARVAAKSTLLETRSGKLARIGATGEWPFDVEFSGADQTHRFSGGNGAGGNPQNFTNPARILDPVKKERAKALRQAVEAPDGYDLVVGDFANIELRIVAYLSRDPGLVEAIEVDRDIYCDFASAFYGRKITKDDKAERHFGKCAILGLGYGMGFKKFIKTVRSQTGRTIDETTSRRAVELYRTRYNAVPALWEKLGNAIPNIAGALRKQYNGLPVQFGQSAIWLPSGLPMRFPNLREEIPEGEMYPEWVYEVYRKGHLERAKLYGGKVLENISQGLAGELCKQAMVELGDLVAGQVHDELHLVARRAISDIARNKMQRAMTRSPEWLKAIRLSAEVHIGKTWGDCK